MKFVQYLNGDETTRRIRNIRDRVNCRMSDFVHAPLM